MVYQNKLTVNIDKMIFKCFGEKQCFKNALLIINGANSKRVPRYKYLCCQLDSKLSHDGGGDRVYAIIGIYNVLGWSTWGR